MTNSFAPARDTVPHRDRTAAQVVTLLRLSPLLPLALSNYLYGLTSVDLPSYVAGSWLGMLPGTIAYVTAGARPHRAAGRLARGPGCSRLRAAAASDRGRRGVRLVGTWIVMIDRELNNFPDGCQDARMQQRRLGCVRPLARPARPRWPRRFALVTRCAVGCRGEARQRGAHARAGSYGRALIDNDEASLGGVKGWQVALGVGVTLVALLYMGRLAQQALDEAEAEEGAAP